MKKGKINLLVRIAIGIAVLLLLPSISTTKPQVTISIVQKALALTGSEADIIPGANINREFQPYWDFRQWGGVAATPHSQIYTDYMDMFAAHGICASILTNPKSLPPFKMERLFLADAAKRGVKVWIRTNRVTPKSGIPGKPNSTLDFALDQNIQQEVLDYLLAYAELSEEYPNVTGLIIGGEEWIGANVDKDALSRHKDAALRALGFDITGNLTKAQKIRFFDWMQKIQNDWYSKIWDTVKARYPDLELFIYPSTIAVCGSRWSSFPRPCYWDVHDLIVNRQKHFSIMSSACTIEDPLGSDQTAAFGAYWRAATEGKVPFYLLLQVNRCYTHTPTPQQLNSDIQAAIDSGARGVGYWPVDMDTAKDIYYTDQARWQAVFQAIANGYRYQPAYQEVGLYVVKPRYSQYWQKDDFQTLSTLAALRRAGLNPQFLLTEQVTSRPLPPEAKLFYVPETFKYETPPVLVKLLGAGKPIFFGLGAAEQYTPDQKPLLQFYSLMGMKKIIPPVFDLKPGIRELIASAGPITYQLEINSPFNLPYWSYAPEMAKVTFKHLSNGLEESLPLVFSDGQLVFLADSDLGLLISSSTRNQDQVFMQNLLAKFLVNPVAYQPRSLITRRLY